MAVSRSVVAPVPVTRHYEEVVCDVCGATGGREVARIPGPSAVQDPLQRFCLEGLEFPRAGIALVECSSCGFGYQNPRPSEPGLATFYDRFYDPSGPATAYHRTAQPELDQARFRAIEATGRSSGVVLDVGAGNGYALEAFPEDRWERHGLDVSSVALETMTGRVAGVVAHIGALRSAGLTGLSFDVITMNSTLEHLRDPVDSLVEAHRLLKPGGLLVFNVPNLACPSRSLANWCRRPWIGFTPEHLNYFSLSVLRPLAGNLGYRSARHHTVGYEESRPRAQHLRDQGVRVVSGVKRLALGQPEGWDRVVAGLGIILDWPLSSTALGRRLAYGENITGFWER